MLDDGRRFTSYHNHGDCIAEIEALLSWTVPLTNTKAARLQSRVQTGSLWLSEAFGRTAQAPTHRRRPDAISEVLTLAKMLGDVPSAAVGVLAEELVRCHKHVSMSDFTTASMQLWRTYDHKCRSSRRCPSPTAWLALGSWLRPPIHRCSLAQTLGTRCSWHQHSYERR